MRDTISRYSTPINVMTVGLGVLFLVFKTFRMLRKVIWFSPPYSLNVKTNIGKVFLKLVRKRFPRSDKLSKIFNLNTIKISYSSMPNVKNLIKQHNSKILNKDRDKIQRPCNCRIKEICPLNDKCLHQLWYTRQN